MKNNFITGLVLLLPITLTLWIVVFVIDIFTDPFLNFAEYLLFRWPFFREFYGVLIIKGMILACLIALIFLTGVLAKNLFLKYIFSFGNLILNRIPFVNKVYYVIQDLIHSFLEKEDVGFKKVVLVPYPHEKAYCMALITFEGLPEGSDEKYKDKASVFVVGSPNPTLGFVLLYDKSKILELDLTVEQAMKYIVSCGGYPINFKVIN